MKVSQRRFSIKRKDVRENVNVAMFHLPEGTSERKVYFFTRLFVKSRHFLRPLVNILLIHRLDLWTVALRGLAFSCSQLRPPCRAMFFKILTQKACRPLGISRKIYGHAGNLWTKDNLPCTSTNTSECVPRWPMKLRHAYRTINKGKSEDSGISVERGKWRRGCGDLSEDARRFLPGRHSKEPRNFSALARLSVFEGRSKFPRSALPTLNRVFSKLALFLPIPFCNK